MRISTSAQLIVLTLAVAGRLAATSQMVFFKDTGTGLTTFQSVAADNQGNTYVAGTVSTGATGTNLIGPRGGVSDIKVVKLNGAGQVVWSTVIGGSGIDIARGISVAPNFQIFLAIESSSTDFPLAASNTGTAIVAKLSANGATLGFATRLSGGGAPLKVVTDGNLNSYIMGDTIDNTFPQVSQQNPPAQNAPDPYFAKLDSNGAIVLAGTFNDPGFTPIVSDFAASSQGFWMVSGASLRRIDAFGNRDGFGLGLQSSPKVATDSLGEVYVAEGISTNARIMKVSRATLSTVFTFSKVMTGGGAVPQSIAVNAAGEASATFTTSGDMSTFNAIQGTGNSTSNNVVVRLSANGFEQFSSFLGIPLGSTTPSLFANTQGIVMAVNGSHVARVVEQAADVKVEGIQRFKNGNQSRMIVRVTNSGPDATDSGFQATIPGQPVGITTSTGSCSISNVGVVSCQTVFLGPGAFRTIEMVTVPPASGNLDATPMASSSTLDPNLSNNSISFSFLP